MSKIALLGFGEAARAFVAGWKTVPGLPLEEPLATYDIKIEDAAERTPLRQACARLELVCAETLQQAFADRATIFSLVTADRALEAAEAAAKHVAAGVLYLDCNSCAPSTKKAAARLIGGAGARYIDVAVMAPVHPARHRTPLLIAGERAEEAGALLSSLDMKARIVGREVGQASAIKMLRSVMIKGIEALTAECLLAARRAGVEEAVIGSLQASDPGFDWMARSAYNLERMMVHGARRAAEMQEVAATLRDLGLPDRMTMAASEWQREIAALALEAAGPSLSERADRILARLDRDDEERHTTARKRLPR